jgi:hypothetical protein
MYPKRSAARAITRRPIGTKQAKRRKFYIAQDSKHVGSVASIAKSQRKMLEKSKRRKTISLMQSEDVPEEMHKTLLRAMRRIV